jgi:hypothetical protein
MYYWLQVVDPAVLETAAPSTQLAIPAVAATAEQTAAAAVALAAWLKYSTIQLFQAVKLDCTWVWVDAKCLKIIDSKLVNKVSQVSLVT